MKSIFPDSVALWTPSNYVWSYVGDDTRTQWIWAEHIYPTGEIGLTYTVQQTAWSEVVADTIGGAAGVLLGHQGLYPTLAIAIQNPNNFNHFWNLWAHIGNPGARLAAGFHNQAAFALGTINFLLGEIWVEYELLPQPFISSWQRRA